MKLASKSCYKFGHNLCDPNDDLFKYLLISYCNSVWLKWIMYWPNFLTKVDIFFKGGLNLHENCMSGTALVLVINTCYTLGIGYHAR